MVDPQKKIVIKNFRQRSRQVGPEAASKIWSSLSSAIDEIHNRNSSTLSFEELYRNAYNLVIQKHGTLLYDGVSDKLTSHLLSAAEHLSTTPESTLLDELSHCFAEHVTTMIMVKDILMYMDRTYVAQHRRKPVYDLGLHLYRLTVWERSGVQNRCTELLLQSISHERSGLLIDDRSLLRSIISMLLQLGAADGSNVYERDFESVFLGTTQEFYRTESMNFLAENSASEYVKKAEARLEEEAGRSVALGLPQTTDGPLRHLLEMELVERHAATLVQMENSGFAVLLKHGDHGHGQGRGKSDGDSGSNSSDNGAKVAEMAAMYNLFARVPSSVDFLRDALCERVKADGKALIADQDRGETSPSSFIKGLLAMRSKFTNIAEVAFRGEKKVLKRLKESFEDFLNADTRAANCLAIYADELLKSGLRGASEEEVHTRLNMVILIFRYLSDKDVFESYYKQHLARRLLAGRSVSEEAERIMVSQLKAECGYQFTSKLEGMFNDMRISRDIREAYKTYKRTNPQAQSVHNEQDGQGVNSDNLNSDAKKITKPVEIEVDVLTAGHWPSQNTPSCNLPDQIQGAIDHFTEFYLKKHTGRKLSWQSSTGSVEMQATFGDSTYRLIVSTYQMCILILFNGSNVLTLGQIKTETNIPDMELRRHLISLCTSKHRILRKGSKGKHISGDNDTFTLNNSYKSQFKRVKIPLVSMKEAAKSNAGKGGGPGNKDANGSSKLPPLVEEERRHLVEAAIVRIMKARKTLQHNDLIAEVTKQLTVRFVPPPQFIKKRIEGLIERDYLERSEQDHRLYQYVA
eukprot:CAMPEP_0203664768 /NCGR_PEP_ID=MMETSP0090-20130426/2117_1 /ASSEMBLY_ACC=CAM_ASM_001088 /TAXON_ID=426623 /ORGANISM="Chaetoceros affinis, Strain CCMP159" /LENGTH=803 /DNA_ID=CAMNT_0050528119 /DNA_START=41 /DNA_END=2452 /DNA_ORIENTATION=-